MEKMEINAAVLRMLEYSDFQRNRKIRVSIDSKKVKEFWASRIKKLGKVPCEGMANLEENSKLLKIKFQLERKKAFQYVALDENMTLLDLGAGIGTWSFLFAQTCKEVVAVDYTEEFVKLARQEAKKRNITNVEFIYQPVQQFVSNVTFDVIFISGLLIYLNDEECEQLLSKIPSYSKVGCNLILRDGTGILGRHEIHHKYSENLHAYYSAIYRTKETYMQMFKEIGFELVKDEDMFEEGCVLNKYTETRLRIYLFKRIK